MTDFEKGSVPWNKGKRYKQKPGFSETLSASMKKAWANGVRKGGHKIGSEGRKRMSESHKGINTWMNGRSIPVHVRLKMSETHKRRVSDGVCHLWRGGITKTNAVIRTSFEYKEWRRNVFARDNFACVLCGAKNGFGISIRLEADHIRPFSLFPELRFDVSNGRTLCHSCHKQTDTYMGRIKNIKK